MVWGETLDAKTKLEQDGRFRGKPIKILRGQKNNETRFEFFYGGLGKPNGPGHGHLVSNDGEHVHYWRKPRSEGGSEIINDDKSTEALAGYVF